MPDLVFPPSILRRYKEFIIESALAIPIPSYGQIKAFGSDSTLIGTVSMGTLQATTYPRVAHYVNAKYQAGGKSGDGINGFLGGAIRDTVKNPNPITNGLFSTATIPTFGNGDALSSIDNLNLPGIFSATGITTQDTLSGSGLPSGITLGDTLAYDVYFIRQGNGSAPTDPGVWRISSFSATYALLLFGPVPVPPT